MSLISDALRKADPSGETSPASLSSRSLWISRIFLTVSIVAVLAVLGVVTKTREQAHSRPEAVNSVPSVVPSSMGSTLLRQADSGLNLEGIIRGGNGKSLALINNRILEEGDAIQGSRIVRVDEKQVHVEEKNGTIRMLKLTTD